MSITLNDEKLTGLILASASTSSVIPEGFLLCDGSAISRSVYENLFSVVPSTTSTITMTIASPCVVTWASHGLATGHSIQFSTTGALPTFSTVQTVYYIRVINTNTFNLYNTLSNAMNTGATTGIINTSGSQSGVHTGLVYYWGNGNGSTTFNIPDGRGVYLRGIGSPTAFLDSTSYTYIIGQKIDDAMQGHIHSGNFVYNAAGYAANTSGDGFGMNLGGTVGNPTLSGSFGTPRTLSETRVKSIGVRYYIKY
jgi:microcystin-dependent protein